MSFRNQSEANIANAQKSTGPKSQAGKLRTRLNAYKHGLTGQIHLLTAAENEAFELHCAGIRESLQPVGALEIELAQGIAEDHWRLKRARAIETAIFACGHFGQMGHLGGSEGDESAEVLIDEALCKARTWIAKGDNFQLLALYEQRIHRAIAKSMAELRTLRAERKTAREQALEEVQLLAQLAYSKGETYDPAADFPPEIVNIGFEFSSARRPPPHRSKSAPDRGPRLRQKPSGHQKNRLQHARCRLAASTIVCKPMYVYWSKTRKPSASERDMFHSFAMPISTFSTTEMCYNVTHEIIVCP